MHQVDRIVTPLRVLLALLFAGLLGVQGLMVAVFLHEAADNDGALPVPVLVILGAVCLQVIAYFTWRLLTMVRAGSIFTENAFRWVDGILWTLGSGLVLWWGFAGVVGFSARFSDADIPPGVVLMLGILGLAGVVVLLLVVVMRALLRQATSLRAEMEGVI
ncbi:DUF2975 domain-containing protein [Zhihengliuella halotolerans]|uniref:DUF2975 family protein n=1 Tax=Zhihengliuella halotolerans TaxID=370736 RepID=A0A4V2GA79_9MICC|nr:DUF2975 domain-containing protein [Zhihengliuella halotolerans]RZU63256.1 DUF2975 family protein [Zhihengliuella halotolerans]